MNKHLYKYAKLRPDVIQRRVTRGEMRRCLECDRMKILSSFYYTSTLHPICGACNLKLQDDAKKKRSYNRKKMT